MASPSNEPANRIDIAQRRQKAAQLRKTNHTWQQIADELDYYDKSHARRDVAIAFAQEQKRLGEDLTELRDQETQELEALRAVAWEALSALGVHISSTPDGDIVTTEVDDPELALKAIDRLNKISASLRTLHGLDAPAKIDTTTKVRYSVEGIDMDKLT